MYVDYVCNIADLDINFDATLLLRFAGLFVG